MKSFITGCLLGLVLIFGAAAALPTEYPPEVVGDCIIIFDFEDDVWMVPFVIDGPVSVPVNQSVGWAGSIDSEHAGLHVHLGCLENYRGRCVAPPLSGWNHQFLQWDPVNCHWKHEWIHAQTIYYDIFLYKNGEFQWHNGDWAIGHAGLSFEFGVWHTGYYDAGQASYLNKRETAKE